MDDGLKEREDECAQREKKKEEEHGGLYTLTAVPSWVHDVEWVHVVLKSELSRGKKLDAFSCLNIFHEPSNRDGMNVFYSRVMYTKCPTLMG